MFLKVLLSVLIVLFFVIVITGTLTKSFTARRLRDIDGSSGVYKKLEGNARTVLIGGDEYLDIKSVEEKNNGFI